MHVTFGNITKKLIARFKVGMANVFKMKHINVKHYFLGLEVWQRLEKILLG